MSTSDRKSKRADQRKRRRQLFSILFVAGGLLLVGAVLFFSLRGDRSRNPDFVPEVSGQPSLKLDQEAIDLGDVKLGQTVEASFTLTNVGDQPLRFSQEPYIQVAAGC